jgi:ribosomal small subunit protein bTHX
MGKGDKKTRKGKQWRELTGYGALLKRKIPRQ